MRLATCDSGFTNPRSLSLALLSHLLLHRFLTFCLAIILNRLVLHRLLICFRVPLARRSLPVAWRRLFRCGVVLRLGAYEGRRAFLVCISLTVLLRCRCEFVELRFPSDGVIDDLFTLIDLL